MFTPSQICVLGLIGIAAVVSVKQLKKTNAWVWIVAYWILLTIKNLCDWIGMNGK